MIGPVLTNPCNRVNLRFSIRIEGLCLSVREMRIRSRSGEPCKPRPLLHRLELIRDAAGNCGSEEANSRIVFPSNK
jgi:hypothetical protein